jgi:hypothetical protein
VHRHFQRFWSAVAERSGDTAFTKEVQQIKIERTTAIQSGVALIARRTPKGLVTSSRQAFALIPCLPTEF